MIHLELSGLSSPERGRIGLGDFLIGLNLLLFACPPASGLFAFGIILLILFFLDGKVIIEILSLLLIFGLVNDGCLELLLLLLLGLFNQLPNLLRIQERLLLQFLIVPLNLFLPSHVHRLLHHLKLQLLLLLLCHHLVVYLHPLFAEVRKNHLLHIQSFINLNMPLPII